MFRNLKQIIDNQILNSIRKRATSNELPILVYSNDTMGAYIMWEGVAEKKLMNNIFSNLSFEPSNYNCVDVGANIGNHSILFSNFFKKVTSFELQKEVFEVLKLNTRKIHNISIINKGLSDIEKEHFIDKLVLGSNIIVRLLFKLLFYLPKNKLQIVNLHIKKGYNLITCCSSKSKFQIVI